MVRRREEKVSGISRRESEEIWNQEVNLTVLIKILQDSIRTTISRLQTLIEDAQSERASSNKFHEEKVLVRSKDLIAKFNEQTQQLQEYQMNLLLECRLDPFVGRGTYKQQ